MKEKTDSPIKGKQSSSEIEKRYSSYDLFGSKREIIIEHKGHVYRLQITRQDKLILTK